MRLFGTAPVGDFRVGTILPIGRGPVVRYPLEHKIVFVLLAGMGLALLHHFGFMQPKPVVHTETPAWTTDKEAMKAADRDCPNDGSHNLIRDANDEDKWVCVAD